MTIDEVKISNPYIYTYQTICKKNGKSYIGVHCTKNINDGYIGCGIFRDSCARKHFLFHKAVKKYGYASFEKHILSFFDTYQEALEEEKYLVNESWVLNKNNYNTAIGGSAGRFMYSFSEEMKKEIYSKISEKLKGQKRSQETRQNMSKSRFGKKLSEAHIDSLKTNHSRYWLGKIRGIEFKEKMSKSHLGKKLSESHRIKLSESHKGLESKRKLPILQYDINGFIINEFSSITEASNKLNILRTSIINNLKNKSNICGGFIFKYKKEVEVGH